LDSGRILRDILLATLTGSIGFVAFAVFVAVISFYFLLDYAHVRPFLHVTLGRERENRFLALWNQIDKSLSGYLRGQIVVAAIVGTLYGAGLWFLGMNAYAILIGFIAGVGNLIPYIGPILAAIPALIWVFFADAYPAMDDKIRGLVLILLLNAVVQGLDGFVLHPRIAGQGAELHPLVIMLALIAGAQLGIGGMILAVPVTIVIRVLLEELWWKPLTRKRAEEGIFYSDLLAEHSKLPERYMPIPKTKSE
jgi:predicted PurR-regulated permease PerM